jgi:hypothetical protein
MSFKGTSIGTVGQVYGKDCKIEIDEMDCWMNFSNNVTLIINGKKEINCSFNLSELIREFKLDDDTEKLKDYVIFEFPDGGKYVSHCK